ncbi:hypothetical protein ABZP36_029219 [Zizania latifolia]
MKGKSRKRCRRVAWLAAEMNRGGGLPILVQISVVVCVCAPLDAGGGLTVEVNRSGGGGGLTVEVNRIGGGLLLMVSWLVVLILLVVCVCAPLDAEGWLAVEMNRSGGGLPILVHGRFDLGRGLVWEFDLWKSGFKALFDWAGLVIGALEVMEGSAVPPYKTSVPHYPVIQSGFKTWVDSFVKADLAFVGGFGKWSSL